MFMTGVFTLRVSSFCLSNWDNEDIWNCVGHNAAHIKLKVCASIEWQELTLIFNEG